MSALPTTPTPENDAFVRALTSRPVAAPVPPAAPTPADDDALDFMLRLTGWAPTPA